jgi:hypothetical protein
MTGPGQVAGSGEHGNKNFRLHKMQGICWLAEKAGVSLYDAS